MVKAPSCPTLIQKAAGLPDSAWGDVADDCESALPLETWVSELTYQARDRDKARRFLVNRVLVEEDIEKTDQLLEPSERYEFSFYATNMEGDPREIIRFYNARATVEKRIKEARLGFNLDKLTSGLFVVNLAYLHFIMVAYNLLWWFRDSFPHTKEAL